MSPTVESPAPFGATSATGPDFRKGRITLLAKLYLAMGSFFFVAGNLHRAVFIAGRGLLDRASAVHASVLALELGVFLLARSRKLSPRMLPVLEVCVVLLTLTGVAVQTTLMNVETAGYRRDLVVLLATSFVLTSRAVIVPSAPRTSLLISAAGVLPALAVAFHVGTGSGSALETTTFALIFCAAMMAMSTFTSKVIYGLRVTVARVKKLGQYVLERKIGQGGMGEVYLARHQLLRRPTAVKLLPPERAGAATVARFEREVTETSLLTHPNTVAIYDYGRTRDGVFYYAMEYLDGLDLQRIVMRDGRLPPSRVVHVVAQIAGALAEAHGRGLVHRDMKPANVILCERGGVKDTVKVLDFGLVKHVTSADPGVTEGDALIGTPRYLSPEALRSPELVDARSDLYAVGAIAYFLLTGVDVFDAKTVMEVCAKHLHEAPKAPSARIDQPLPADLEALVLACLAKDPHDRPASATRLREALLACDVPRWTPRDAEVAWTREIPMFPAVASNDETDATLDARTLLAG